MMLSPVVLVSREQAVLVIEKKPHCILSFEHVPAVLLGSYFIFNIQYPKGCANFFQLLEILLLDSVPQKVHHKVSTVLASLSH